MPLSATAKIDSEQVRARLKLLLTTMPEEIEAALYQETEVETTESKRRCPVRFGTLRGSIHTEGPKREGKLIYCEIVAGGPSAPYALYVHEDLTAHHEVGQAKFIESTVFESAATIMQRVAKRVDLNRG